MLHYKCVYLEDHVQLVNLRLAHEERLAKDELAKDAPDRPHVDSCGVLLCSKKKLGAPIPQGDYNRCVRLQRGAILSCKAKIPNLQDPFMAEKEVGGFEVTVKDPVVM